jgi:predicted nucleotidyltransferase
MPLSKFVRSIISGGTVLNQDFKEFVQSLNDNQVRYLIVGGYAVAFHGHPRYTKDLDVWVERSPSNAERIVRALEQFGFGSLGLTDSDFIQPNQIIQLGHPPCRIDLLTTLSAVDFETCHQARLETEVDGVKVNFIDLENLKTTKRAAGRHQDLADIENLEAL